MKILSVMCPVSKVVEMFTQEKYHLRTNPLNLQLNASLRCF